ncbi:MAG: hypothetical protein U0840_03600 [Gemmataceae bacterium]
MNESSVPPGPPKKRAPLLRQVRLPMLSGKVSAAWLVVCFGLAALVIPVALKLPTWIEAEIVLGVWWAIWFGLLTYLLHRGWHISDDYSPPRPRSWWSGWTEKKSDGDGAGAIFDLGGDALEVEGCAWVVGILLALLLLVGLAWVVIEVAVPVLAFLFYCVTRFMLAQVVNDRHGCEDHLGRSSLWGGLWATVYTAPLAGAVWVIHLLAESARVGGG